MQQAMCEIFEVVCLLIVQVSVWEGINRVFEEIGVPKEAVHILINEAPKSIWSTGGKLHSEKELMLSLLGFCCMLLPALILRNPCC
jgi:hypothetical protein